jgi:hypothetical protein
MKKILIAVLLLVGCTKETGGKYEGKVVEMVFNPLNRSDNRIDVLTGTDVKRVYDSPMFSQLLPGDHVVVECTGGFFYKCYVTQKLQADK